MTTLLLTKEAEARRRPTAAAATTTMTAAEASRDDRRYPLETSERFRRCREGPKSSNSDGSAVKNQDARKKRTLSAISRPQRDMSFSLSLGLSFWLQRRCLAPRLSDTNLVNRELFERLPRRVTIRTRWRSSRSRKRTQFDN